MSTERNLNEAHLDGDNRQEKCHNGQDKRTEDATGQSRARLQSLARNKDVKRVRRLGSKAAQRPDTLRRNQLLQQDKF